jgi:hypothetical protein
MSTKYKYFGSNEGKIHTPGNWYEEGGEHISYNTALISTGKSRYDLFEAEYKTRLLHHLQLQDSTHVTHWPLKD